MYSLTLVKIVLRRCLELMGGYRIFYLDVDISDLDYVDNRVLYIFLDMHG